MVLAAQLKLVIPIPRRFHIKLFGIKYNDEKDANWNRTSDLKLSMLPLTHLAEAYILYQWFAKSHSNQYINSKLSQTANLIKFHRFSSALHAGAVTARGLVTAPSLQPNKSLGLVQSPIWRRANEATDQSPSSQTRFLGGRILQGFVAFDEPAPSWRLFLRSLSSSGQKLIDKIGLLSALVSMRNRSFNNCRRKSGEATTMTHLNANSKYLATPD